MAMSASLEIMNDTGSSLMFTSIDQVNDDATWSVVPPVGTPIPNGKSVVISMGNSSVFFAPKGVGADCKFVCEGNFKMGQVYFDDPAVGEHTFTYDDQEVFGYAVTNPTGNSYVVTVTAKK